MREMDYWKWMISPDCCLIVTKRSALLIFAMKMVPKPSSGWQKWNVRPTGYYLELLPNFLPLALVETSLVSEVGVLEAAVDVREGFRVFTSLCLPASLLLSVHTAVITSLSEIRFLHFPFSITGKCLHLQLPMTVLTCFELLSFLWDGAAEVSLGGCRRVWTLGNHWTNLKDWRDMTLYIFY